MNSRHGQPAFGVGFYTATDAGRLLKTAPRNINRWLGGYHYTHGDETVEMPPLWTPQLERAEDHIELGFRDLIELRFVVAFVKAGLKVQTIRRCLDIAREIAQDERPFSTRRFFTDGNTIFLETILSPVRPEAEFLDLRQKQYVIKRLIAQSLTDLEIEKEVVARWRPLPSRRSIVLDPSRSFGRPIVDEFGVPTAALAHAFEAESKSARRVAAMYEVSTKAVHDAVYFERYLQKAA